MYTSQKNKTIISLSDEKISYITLAHDKKGFYIKNYDLADLEKGVIKNGEILRADFLQKILQKIYKKISFSSVDVILPHDMFTFDKKVIPIQKRKSNDKSIKEFLYKNLNKISWAKTHSYSYDFWREGDTLQVLFRCIPQETYLSYKHVFKKAGFKLNSLQSELVSYAHTFPRKGNLSQIFIDDNYTYLIDYKGGIFLSAKKFNLSYSQFILEIKKQLNISEEKAAHILQNYGVQETHRDEKVFRSLIKKMDPLLQFLRKKKKEKSHRFFIHYRNTPIKGFSNILRKQFPHEVYDICVLCLPQYNFHEVLKIHKKESYFFEPLIARALELYSKK